MTLTEEQRGTVAFDLEKNRAAIDSAINSLLCEGWDNEASTVRRLVAEIERLRASLVEHEEHENQTHEVLGNILGTDDTLENVAKRAATRIKDLKADLEQSERVIEARLDAIDQQAARIKELEGLLEKSEEWYQEAAVDGASFIHDLMKNCNSLRSRTWKAEAQTKALEDALAEGLTNFLHYRASCYDPARRCPYAKECDDCSTWDACGHVEMFRSEARQRLQADGKIGPGDGA